MSVVYIGSVDLDLPDVGKYEKIVSGDLKGCYKVIAGGLGVVNSEGHYFPATREIRELFSRSSTINRSASKNVLKGEADHPKKMVGESKDSFSFRFMSVSTDRVAFLIRAVEILDATPMSGQNNLVYPIALAIEPIGVFGDALKSDLDNPNSNTSFSIRCLSKRGTDNSGRVTRSIFHVITWDWVTEPGINISDKKHAVEMSSRTTEMYSSEELMDIIDSMSNDDMTMESSSNRLSKDVIKRLDHNVNFLDKWK